MSVMEAIAAHLPVLCSDIRGARDLVDKKLLFDPRSAEAVAAHIRAAMSGEIFADLSFDDMQRFDTANVIRQMNGIYAQALNKQRG